MDDLLRQNIASQLKKRGMKPAELARRAHMSYSTLQTLMDSAKAIDPQVSTLGKIAAGLGVPPGSLLENPNAMEQPAQPEKSREELFAALVEKAIHLDKDGLAMVLAAIDSGLADSDDDCEPLGRLENEK